MDEIETTLYHQKIEAEHRYLLYIQQKMAPRFAEETRNYVWVKDHWAYRMFFPQKDTPVDIQPDSLPNNNDNNDNNNNADKSDLYRKLSMICHPDKCPHEWAHRIFTIINNANETNDIQTLAHLYAHYQTHQTFDNYTAMDDKIREINTMTNALWYQWYYSKNMPYLREVFVDSDVYIVNADKKIDELKKGNDELKKQLAVLEKRRNELEKEEKKCHTVDNAVNNNDKKIEI